MIDLPLSFHWRVRKQLMYLYEIDADALIPHVPPSLELVEARPGVGLVAVELLHYHTDHFRPGYPEFYEMVVTAAVQPDLSLKMPMPRFCMHAISVISDSQEFVDGEGDLIKTPTVLVPKLRMEFTPDGASADVFDGDRPIITCRNTAGVAPYAPKELWGQYYTNTAGLQHGAWHWQGEMFEHQKRGDFGTFHPHAMWNGLDITRIRGCYRQMMAKPDLTTNVRFYHVGEVTRRRAAARAGS